MEAVAQAGRWPVAMDFAPRNLERLESALQAAQENGRRLVVTAPLCGSAGVVPAALKVRQDRFGFPSARVHDALLVAGLVGLAVAKKDASISGAEVGCPGEVGTASALAAGTAPGPRGVFLRATSEPAAEPTDP
ncbi:MAG: L-serine ammonia-lyase, iron-sulfur-dependent, subunit alpha [Candidatus Bipolaricaulaceae bacterium]